MSRTLSGLQNGEFDEVDIFHSLTINGDGGQENYVVASNGDNTIDWKEVGTLIPNNSITNQQLADNTITKDKIAADTITASELADNSVTTDKIADGNVTKDKIVDNTIPGAKIQDNTLSQVKLEGAIPNTKLQNKTISGIELGQTLGILSLRNGSITYTGQTPTTVPPSGKLTIGTDVFDPDGADLTINNLVNPVPSTLTIKQLDAYGQSTDSTYDTTADTTVTLPAPPTLSSVTFSGGTPNTPITYDPTDSAATSINIPNMLTPQYFVGGTNITSSTTTQGTGAATNTDLGFHSQVATNLDISSDVPTNGNDIDLAAPSSQSYPPPDDGKIKNGTIENCVVNTQGNAISTINSSTGIAGVISSGNIYCKGDLIGGPPPGVAGGGACRLFNMYGIKVSTTGTLTFPKANPPYGGYGAYTEPNYGTGTMYVDENGFVKIEGYHA